MDTVNPRLFTPKSVALVGASDEAGSTGNSLRQNLISTFQGTTYLVNPNHTSLEGSRCYASVADIPGEVDLVIIAVPAKHVPSIIEQAAAKHIPASIIISAGFREIGPEGHTQELRIENMCQVAGMTMIGPNCLGIMNPHVGLNATFAAAMPAPGNVAFITQSGALGTAILDYAKDYGIGISKFVSIGNKASVDEVSLLTYLAQDTDTHVILLYLEDVKNAAAFIQASKAIANGKTPKPIILLKSGVTVEGARASVSHTGALGGNDAYYDALTRQSHAIRVHSIADFLATAVTFAHNPVPKGSQVAIITNAGGPGILMTDAAITAGLSLSSLSKNTEALLQKQLPSYASVKNPVDLLGDAKADRYEVAITAVHDDPNIHSLLVLLTPQSGTEVEKTAEAISRCPKDKPLVVTFMGDSLVEPGVEILKHGALAVTPYPEEAARALGELTKFAGRSVTHSEAYIDEHHDPSIASALLSALPADLRIIPEREAGKILSSYGFPMLETLRAGTREEVEAAVTKIGKPCALKIISPDITHKRDVSGVELNVTADTAAAAYDRIMDAVSKKAPSAKLEGVMVVEMAPLGLECILGMVRQNNFGTMIMVGMGGTYVEVTKDVSFGVLPLDRTDARNMLESLHAKKLFDGYRGSPPLDKEALVDAIGRLSVIAHNHPEITEIDINPFVLYPSGAGAKVVDVRMIRDTSERV